VLWRGAHAFNQEIRMAEMFGLLVAAIVGWVSFREKESSVIFWLAYFFVAASCGWVSLRILRQAEERDKNTK